MNTCTCGGKLLRHGTYRYPSGAISIRYICKACKKTLIAPIAEDMFDGFLKLGGRPTVKDWRYAVGA